MKISYAVTVCNELTEISKLLPFLMENKREKDEVVVFFDSCNGTKQVEDYLRASSQETYAKFRWMAYHFDGHFAHMKNALTEACLGDYIFQIDADEMVSKEFMEMLPEILETNQVDVLRVPRINTVSGLTTEHVRKWGWSLNDKGWANFPDYQWRIYKRTPTIKWKNKVHEVLEGYQIMANLPALEEYCLLHHKDIARQEKQNQLYSTLS
jgi:hypothetical protein